MIPEHGLDLIVGPTCTFLRGYELARSGPKNGGN